MIRRVRMMLLMLQAACIIATLVTNTVEAGAAPSSRSSSRGLNGLNVPEPFQPDGPPLVVVYVSTTGDDHASGTADSPLRSFGAARDMARTVSADRVEFASGTYLLNATQVLTLRDSGTASKPRTYAAAPGADVTFSGAKPVTGWRGVTLADAAYPYLDDVARAAVQVAPLVGTSFPSMLFDSGAERARLSERAVRQLPDTNVIYSLVPQARQNSETCVYLGQHDSEKACRTAALAVRDLWAYAWHDPTIITDPDFARGCYGRQDSHGSRTFQAQEGVMSGVFTSSMLFREFSEWEISSNVTTQHRCPGAECEYFDPETAKRTMSLSIPHLDSSVGNDPAALFLRIYLGTLQFQPPVSAAYSLFSLTLPPPPPPPPLSLSLSFFLRTRSRLCDGTFQFQPPVPAAYSLFSHTLAPPFSLSLLSSERASCPIDCIDECKQLHPHHGIPSNPPPWSEAGLLHANV